MPPTFYTAEPDAADRYACRHIFSDGRRCASPALRHEPFCYHHHTTRRPVEDPASRKARLGTFTLPAVELADRTGIQIALSAVLERIASNDLDLRRAGLLLYGLQIASLNLPRTLPTLAPAGPLIEQTIEDPVFGTLAPPASLDAVEPKSVLESLLEKMETLPINEEWARAYYARKTH